MGFPSKRISPVFVPCGCKMGFNCRRSVDLPQPDLPQRTVNELASIESETFWSAGTVSVGYVKLRSEIVNVCIQPPPFALR